MKKVFFLLFLALQTFAADYKTGIDFTFSGSAGTDYAIEQFYSTPQVNDSKVVYIKAATTISMAYNARHAGFYTCKSYPGVHDSGTFIDGETATQAAPGNPTIIIFGTQPSGTLLFAKRTGGSGSTTQTGQFTGNTSGAKFTPSNGATDRDYGVLGAVDSYGVIRYRIDRDLQFAGQFASGSPGELNPTYSGAISFGGLTYDGSTAVVGTTGDNGLTLNLANAATYYWRGMVDSVGDEWHMLTVGSDNTTNPLINDNYELFAGDGGVHLFVVNPKTPCLSITVTGNAQFYTTPPKMYFIPKIRDQVTYFNAGTGTVTITLKDINGNNIWWRLNGGSFADAGSSTKTFTASDFANTGATPNTLEYYYAGNVAYTKTRTIYKNPAHPSAGETHGTIFRSPLDTWATVNTRLAAAGPINDWYTTLETQDSANNRISISGYAYVGWRNAWSNASINALDAIINSNWDSIPSGFSQTRGWFAKAALLDNCMTWDQVGLENEQHAGTPGDHESLASRENIFRGYYDMRPMADLVFLYDVMVGPGGYRDDQNANGITAIENIKVRDDIARCISQQLFVGQMASPNVWSAPGMWDTARCTTALAMCYVIPTYSRPVYGTCGLDGNTTVYTYCPFPTDTLTWKKVLIDNNATLGSWPNYRFRMGVEGILCSPSGVWGNRQDYANFSLMGSALLFGINVSKINNTGLAWPDFNQMMLACANGTLTGTDPGTLQLSQPTAYNSRFPLSAALGIAYTATQPSGGQSANTTMQNSGVFGLLYWDDPLVIPGIPSGLFGNSKLVGRAKIK